MTKETAIREYFEKSIAITAPQGDHIFEFLVEAKDQPGVFERIVKVFAAHDVDVRSVSGAPEEGKQKFVTNLFVDFSAANCTAGDLLEELKRLPFVRKAYYADLKGRMFDRFLFPLQMLGGRRVLLMRVEPLVQIENRLVERFGSAGRTIMYEEGRSYAEVAFLQYREALPRASAEALLENIKDGLRVTGWGIFDFKRVPEGFEVTIVDPPHLINNQYVENHFFFGATAKILEELYGGGLRVISAHVIERKLVIQFQKVERKKKDSKT